MIAAPVSAPPASVAVHPDVTRAGLCALLGGKVGVRLRHARGGGWSAAVPERGIVVIGARSPLAALLGAIRLAYLSGVPK